MPIPKKQKIVQIRCRILFNESRELASKWLCRRKLTRTEQLVSRSWSFCFRSSLDDTYMSQICSFKANIDAVCSLVVFRDRDKLSRSKFCLICFAVAYYFRWFLGVFSDVLANSGARVLFCSGGGSGIYSLLVAFPRWQNHLHKYGRLPDDVLLSVL